MELLQIRNVFVLESRHKVFDDNSDATNSGRQLLRFWISEGSTNVMT